MTIEPVTIDNLTILTEVARRAYSDHYLHLWHDNGDWYLDQYFSLERFKEEWENPDFKFYLIYEEQLPVGFLKLNLKPSGKDPETCMEIERIYLEKEATGKGIGSQVMKKVEAIAREFKRSGLLLKVMDSSQDAIAFYKKMGYAIDSTHRLTFQQMKADLRGMYIMTKNTYQPLL
jgi:ribosomal protein S18 acetylase RimI-like enzyme